MMTFRTKTFIDLFAGTGGFAYALENTNHDVVKWKCVMGNDMDANAAMIYQTNFPSTHFRHADLFDIPIHDIPNHDLLCGGFPCQPFSIAGKQEGFKDTRSNVFWRILEILKSKRPSMCLLENVKNLVSHDGGRTFQVIMQELRSIGYHVKYHILDTAKITRIPHHRERIYIVGFLDVNLYNAFQFEKIILPEQNVYRLSDIIQRKGDDIPMKYYYGSHLKVYDMIRDGVSQGIHEDAIYQYRRFYVRQNKKGQCPTLTANMGSGGHNVPIIRDDKGIRKLTPRECFLLQGFPSSYQFPQNIADSGLYKLAGNAISVHTVSKIVSEINRVLSPYEITT